MALLGRKSPNEHDVMPPHPFKRGLLTAAVAVPVALLALSWGLTAGATVASQPSLYVSATDLGTLGGPTYADAVNNSGEVVGYGYVAPQQNGVPDQPEHAFVWTAASGMRDIGGLGGVNTYATQVNASGEVAGNSDITGTNSDSSPSQGAHAFVWSATAGMTDLGTLGGSGSFVSDLNDNGEVVGSSWTVGDAQLHAFYWSKATGMIDIGVLGTGDRSYAVKINNSGQVAGMTYTTPTPSTGTVPPYHAFIWTLAGGMVDLGTLAGGNTYVTGMNSAGQIVGWADVPRGSHAFSWTQATGMTDIGTVGGNSSIATGVTDGGEVVGGGSQAAHSHGRLRAAWSTSVDCRQAPKACQVGQTG